MAGDDEMVEGLRRLAEDPPLQHDCENCADSAMAPISQLPPGWAYVTMKNGLWESLDDIDNHTLILCAICVGLLRKVVPKLGVR